jgi:hypothetical protein
VFINIKCPPNMLGNFFECFICRVRTENGAVQGMNIQPRKC